MISFNFSKSTLKAFIILAAFLVLTTGMEYLRLDTSFVTKISIFLITVFNSAFIVFMIDRICRKSMVVGDVLVETTGFSVWGYLWRGYLTFYSSTVVWVALVLVVPLNLPGRSNYDGLTLVLIEPLVMACIGFSVWLIFSSRRVEQFKFLIRSLRGF
jgi:hypothetical protein